MGVNILTSVSVRKMMHTSFYRVNKAVRARLLVLVDLVDDQENHTHQEGQGTDH